WITSRDGETSLYAFEADRSGNGFTLLKTLPSERYQLAAISPDGKVLATIVGKPSEHPPYFLPSDKIRLLDARTGEFLGDPLEHKGPVRTLFFNKDGTQLVVGAAAHNDTTQTETSVVVVWDLAGRKQIATSAPMIGRIKASTLAANGQLFGVSVFEYTRDK